MAHAVDRHRTVLVEAPRTAHAVDHHLVVHAEAQASVVAVDAGGLVVDVVADEAWVSTSTHLASSQLLL